MIAVLDESGSSMGTSNDEVILISIALSSGWISCGRIGVVDVMHHLLEIRTAQKIADLTKPSLSFILHI